VTGIDRSHSQHSLAHAPWPQPHHCYGRYHNGVRRRLQSPFLHICSWTTVSDTRRQVNRRSDVALDVQVWIPWSFAMRTIAFFLWRIAKSWSRRHLPAEDARTRSDTPMDTFKPPLLIDLPSNTGVIKSASQFTQPSVHSSSNLPNLGSLAPRAERASC
jgi:hypothetical protein